MAIEGEESEEGLVIKDNAGTHGKTSLTEKSPKLLRRKSHFEVKRISIDKSGSRSIKITNYEDKEPPEYIDYYDSI